jgi:hypothetical protein
MQEFLGILRLFQEFQEFLLNFLLFFGTGPESERKKESVLMKIYV